MLMCSKGIGYMSRLIVILATLSFTCLATDEYNQTNVHMPLKQGGTNSSVVAVHDLLYLFTHYASDKRYEEHLHSVTSLETLLNEVWQDWNAVHSTVITSLSKTAKSNAEIVNHETLSDEDEQDNESY